MAMIGHDVAMGGHDVAMGGHGWPWFGHRFHTYYYLTVASISPLISCHEDTISSRDLGNLASRGWYRGARGGARHS